MQEARRELRALHARVSDQFVEVELLTVLLCATLLQWA